ncbi:hypothetical protein [Gallibacterium sp. AGMB14963]|uniref:hypothetical protein n=1 Tax=Gallibacterium faecale TaxID=3019086 RepID=UPI0022F1B77E|nr:hypothetical protein [Gallibacterium sp. AGMB14963]MDA3979656.1 hypothetical protein [Gallibacterium sp. AGMB14963]
MMNMSYIKEMIAPLTHIEKEQVLTEQYNAAIEQDNLNLAADIANYVLDEVQTEFHIRFRAHCFRFLLQYTQEKLSNLPETAPESESDKYFENLMELIWKFKWIIPHIPEDANATMEEIDYMLELMKDYYQYFEFSMAPVYTSKMLQYMARGDRDKAQEYFKLWQNEPADDMNDCPACVAADKVNYYYFIGDYAKVLDLSEDILSGKLACAEVPHITYAAILYSLLETHQFDKAKKLLPKAVKLIEQEKMLRELPDLMIIAYQLGETEIAANLIEKYHESIFQIGESVHILKVLMALSYHDTQNYDTAKELALTLDQRNGNQFYQNKIDSLGKQIGVLPHILQ